MEEPQWFYKDGAVKRGPFTQRDFLKLVAAHALPVDVEVWRDGFSQWTPLETIRNSEFPELAVGRKAGSAPPMSRRPPTDRGRRLLTVALALGTLAIAFVLLYPPWVRVEVEVGSRTEFQLGTYRDERSRPTATRRVHAGHGWIFDPPQGRQYEYSSVTFQLDRELLLVQCGAIACLTAVAVLGIRMFSRR